MTFLLNKKPILIKRVFKRFLPNISWKIFDWYVLGGSDDQRKRLCIWSSQAKCDFVKAEDSVKQIIKNESYVI